MAIFHTTAQKETIILKIYSIKYKYLIFLKQQYHSILQVGSKNVLFLAMRMSINKFDTNE